MDLSKNKNALSEITGMNDREANRRRALKLIASLGIASAISTLVEIRPAMAGQVPKTVVNYQSHPKGGMDCATCIQFMPPQSCAVVSGKISPKGWCTAYVPK